MSTLDWCAHAQLASGSSHLSDHTGVTIQLHCVWRVFFPLDEPTDDSIIGSEDGDRAVVGDEREHLEEHLDEDEDDHDPLEHARVRVVVLRGEHVEELLDDVEPLVEPLGAPCDLEVLGDARVRGQPLVVLPG